MKANKDKIILFLISVIVLLSSCNKLNEMTGVDAKLFHAQTSSTEESKTFIDNDLQIFWTEDDRLSVFQSSTNEQYRYTGKTGQSEGYFEKVGSEQPGIAYSRNYAIYPYDSNTSVVEEGNFSLTLPATQYYAEHSFGMGTNTMVAVTKTLDDDELLFKNACGYLMLKLYGGDKVRSIKFYGNNGEKIAGAASLTIDEDQNLNISMAESATTEIILDCGEDGVPTSTYKDSPTTFWMVVPPVDFEKGFAVEITNTAGQKTKRSTTKQLSISRNSIKQMAAIKVELQNSNDLLSFSLSDGTNTYDAFDISNGYVNVQVPNETDMTNMTATFQHNGAKVTVNGVEQTSGEGSYDFSDFVNPLTYVVTSESGLEQSYIIRMFNLPVVIVNTPNGQPITSKKIWVGDCSLMILYEGSSHVFGSDVQIRGRGNTTWRHEKKPYTFKLNSQQPILGMPPEKRWNLLANWRDRTLVRNAIGLEIARMAESLDWTPDGRFVELIMNGNYLGNYYLCEHIKVGKNRVDIKEISQTDISPETINGGFLLEFDSYYDETNKFRTTTFNYPVNLKSPDEQGFDIQLAYITEYINELERVLNDPEERDKGTYLNMIDPNSFIDWWLVHEIVGNGVEPNGPWSCYFHKDRGGKLMAGPAWDFDNYTFRTNISGFQLKNALYYRVLFKDYRFVAMVKEKWPIFKKNLEGMEEFIITQEEMIFNSSLRDSQMWPIPKSFDINHDEQLSIPIANQKLLSAYCARIVEIDRLINSLPVDFDTLPGTNEDVNSQQDETDNFNFGF